MGIDYAFESEFDFDRMLEENKPFEESLREAYSLYYNNCLEVGIDAMNYEEWFEELDRLGR